jgi:hypothetical protein
MERCSCRYWQHEIDVSHCLGCAHVLRCERFLASSADRHRRAPEDPQPRRETVDRPRDAASRRPTYMLFVPDLFEQ